MKKLIVLSFSLLAGIISCTAQKTEDRVIGNFQRLKIAGSVNVIYTNSDTLSLKVVADEGELANVETRVENGQLLIENKGTFRSPVKVYLKSSQLNFLEMSGATNFKCTNTIKTAGFDVSLSGSAHSSIDVETAKLNCAQAGASSMVLGGKAEALSLTMSGASSFKGYGLTSVTANVVTTGASNAKVFVSDKIKAAAAGASSIKIKGDPKELNAEATSAASVTRVNGQSAKNPGADSDTVTYNWKGKKILVINGEDRIEYKKEKHDNDVDDFKHWAGFSMGVNGYFNPTMGLNMAKKYNYMDLNYSRSFDYQFNLFEHQFNVVKNYVKIITGLGIDYHLYQFANKTNLNADSAFTWGRIDSTSAYSSYKKNKLRSTYLQVPLLVEFNTSNNPYKTFHIAIGVVGQFLIASRTKQVLEQNKTEVTRVRKDTYNLNPFAAKAHVNFGYKRWTFFGEYNLTPLFESGKGPELYPFTVGLRVIPLT